MSYIPTIMDLNSYISELSSITKIDVVTIKFIVLGNFALMSTDGITFTEASNNIEKDIYSLLNNQELAFTL